MQVNNHENETATSDGCTLVEVHVRDASALALDWACARITNPQWFDDGLMDGDPMYMLDMDDGFRYRPSVDANQAHSLIEDAIKSIERLDDGWRAVNMDGYGFMGNTMLEAVCRGFVFKHSGPFVKVPHAIVSG